MLKKAHISLKLTLPGFHNFKKDDMVLLEIPAWKCMHYYAGFGRIITSVA